MPLPFSSPLPPPQFLFFEINRRCNLKCKHCIFWTYDDADKANYLTSARRTELLEELAQLNPKATLVSCGGEPMLDPEDWFFLAREARRLGLQFFSVINGTGVTDTTVADRVITEGPSEISVSLDHHTASVHDEARGLQGSFDAAAGALRLLATARKRAALARPLYAMTIVCERNYRDLDAMYDYVLNDLGVDKLKLNILQPSFGLATGKDNFYARGLVQDVDALIGIIRGCDDKYGLGLDPTWIQQVEMYHRSMHAHGHDLKRGWLSEATTTEHICNTYERNVMVDRYGFARLCFSPEFKGMQLEKRGDLKRFWKRAKATRALMRTCNRPCGISHSVRRVSASSSIPLPLAAR